jgi:exodeoxyribonuclease-5
MIASQNSETSAFGSGNLLADLIEYVEQGTNCKLIVIGDIAQLPPIGASISPALNTSEYNQFNYTALEIELTEVLRQSTQSGILYNATLLRKQLIADNPLIPKLNLDFSDIICISGEELIDTIQSAYEKYGIEDTCIVCRSNKRANIYNQGVRQRILFREEQIESGDYLMVVKNNYTWLPANDEQAFIANGDIIRIKKIKKYEERYGFHFADVSIQLTDFDNKTIDAKIILETLTADTPSLSQEESKKIFDFLVEDYAHIQPRKKMYDTIKSDPYFNALQVKFAYAVTCHKAQGGQWKAVFVDQGWFTPEMYNVEYVRWLYTAFTRSSDKLYLVNFHESFVK